MTDVAISIKNLGKCYRIYDTPRERLKEILTLGRRKYHREFWALKDVTLDVMKGETLGIIGRNGSGKSTLLQIICGTVAPTAGTVEISGRVSALLELGAGFNPEFTGRENVYMNASILGLSKEEIDEKYQSIVDFAEIGDFIDRPVKTYSSGMYVRLAFAVAVNVEPDILVVDEALAVGDEQFQQKCYSRIRSIRERGCSIVLVTHAHQVVLEQCRRAVLIDQGQILLLGAPKQVTEQYQRFSFAPAGLRDKIRAELRERRDTEDNVPEGAVDAQRGEGVSGRSVGTTCGDQPHAPKPLRYSFAAATIVNPRILTADGARVVTNLRARESYVYAYEVDFHSEARMVRAGMLIKTLSGFEIGGAVTSAQDDPIPHVPAGATLRVRFRFRCCLNSGAYSVNAGVIASTAEGTTFLDRCVDAVVFIVAEQPITTALAVVDFYIEPSTSLLLSKESIHLDPKTSGMPFRTHEESSVYVFQGSCK
jgi:lipopolysaccharide transport system ATP-binding protein